MRCLGANTDKWTRSQTITPPLPLVTGNKRDGWSWQQHPKILLHHNTWSLSANLYIHPATFMHRKGRKSPTRGTDASKSTQTCFRHMCVYVCVCGFMEHISLETGAPSKKRHLAMNGVRSSHLALVLTLGQCPNNCWWWRGFHGNQSFFFFPSKLAKRKKSPGCACLAASRPLVIYPSLLLYNTKPLGQSNKRAR